MLAIRTLLVMLSLGFALTAISACNTFHGMGEDVQSAGEAITGSADKTKDKMSH
jgi:predicted small secreted protein